MFSISQWCFKVHNYKALLKFPYYTILFTEIKTVSQFDYKSDQTMISWPVWAFDLLLLCHASIALVHRSPQKFASQGDESWPFDLCWINNVPENIRRRGEWQLALPNMGVRKSWQWTADECRWASSGSLWSIEESHSSLYRLTYACKYMLSEY